MAITVEQFTKMMQNPDLSIVGAPLAVQPHKSGVGDDLGSTGVYSHPQCVPWSSEWHFQTAVIEEAKRRAILQPEYALLMAIPNGQYRKGQRPEAGLCAGMPDLVLLVQRGGYGGLFIELKIGSNKLRATQRDMHHRLRKERYMVRTIWDSVDEVMKAIEEYLNL